MRPLEPARGMPERSRHARYNRPRCAGDTLARHATSRARNAIPRATRRPGSHAWPPPCTTLTGTHVMTDSFYKYHVFFCLNQRDPGADRPSCANCNAQAMQEYAKKRVKQLGLAGPGQVRINKAGCLDRCEEGPAVVVYPEGTWYTYVDESDIDEIVVSHLQNGQVVERLKIDR
jgi:(2Fe-2S) ferredoxin